MRKSALPGGVSYPVVAATITGAVALAGVFAVVTRSDEERPPPTAVTTSATPSAWTDVEPPKPTATTTAPTATPSLTSLPATTAPSTSAATPAPTSKGTPTTTTRPTPAKPRGVADLVTSVPDCRRGGCSVVAQVKPTTDKSLRFALVKLPQSDADAIEVPFKAALVDVAKGKVTWSSPELLGNPVDGGRAITDAAGHVAFTLNTGVHGSTLYVLDPGTGKPQFFGPDDSSGVAAWSTNTPGARAEDVDGDGLLELLVPVNDYEPSYAEGSTTVYRYAWSGKAYVNDGCTFYASGSETGVDFTADDAECQAG